MRPEREVLGSQRCASSRAVYPKEFTLESPCGARMSAFTLQMKHQAESAQEEGVLERISSRRGGREHPDAASSPKMGPRGDDFRCRESRASAAVTRDGLLPNQRCPSTKSMTGTYGSRSPLRSAPHFRKQKKKKRRRRIPELWKTPPGGSRRGCEGAAVRRDSPLLRIRPCVHLQERKTPSVATGCLVSAAQ